MIPLPNRQKSYVYCFHYTTGLNEAWLPFIGEERNVPRDRKYNRNAPTVASVACVAWRFWLGALSNKGVQGQRNREEIGAEATFYFSRGFAREFRGYAAPALGSTKPPCYAGYGVRGFAQPS